MNTLRTYTFKYNVPVENHQLGKTDLHIDAYGEWREGVFYDNGRPIVVISGPVMSKLTKNQLFLVKDWSKAFMDIERICEEYFMDTFVLEPKTCVEIAEEVLL